MFKITLQNQNLDNNITPFQSLRLNPGAISNLKSSPTYITDDVGPKSEFWTRTGWEVRGSGTGRSWAESASFAKQKLFFFLLNTTYILLKRKCNQGSSFPKDIPIAQVLSLSSCWLLSIRKFRCRLLKKKKERERNWNIFGSNPDNL